MKIALADLPWPFLAQTRVVAQNSDESWHDFYSAVAASGLPAAPKAPDLPSALAFLASLTTSARHKIAHALDAQPNGVPSPHLLKPIDPLAKILLTEGRIALSRSNDQAPAKWVVGFSKFATALADPDAEIRLPDREAHYDAEATLAVVLGHPAARVNAAAAAKSVIGFTLMAEITHRDMFDAEWRTSNSLYAKNCPGLSPLGPAIWIAGVKELDPATEIILAVNGATRQRFAVGDFAHSIANATRAWSRCVLEPGDMVALGAAIAKPRPGAELDSPVPIGPGDRIEIACAPIGTLAARFVA